MYALNVYSRLIIGGYHKAEKLSIGGNCEGYKKKLALSTTL